MNQLTKPPNLENTADVRELAALALKGLSSREQKILNMRFGIDGTGERSHAYIARTLHLSQSNVAAIEARALRKLRHPLRMISSGRLSTSDLQRAIDILSRLQTPNVTPQDVANTIKTELPELSSLADSLPKTRGELYAFIQTLTLILTVMLAIADSNRRSTVSTQTTNVFINRPQIEQPLSKRPRPKKRAKPTKRRVGHR